MQMLRPTVRPTVRPVTPAPPYLPWCNAIFSAKALGKGGVVRRAIRDVDREIGREVFIEEVRRRGFHLVEVGGQYVVICHPGYMTVHF